jgi:hypothetical protein
MPPKEFKPFTDGERVLQGKAVTMGWHKRALNTRVQQGVADLAAFLSDFREFTIVVHAHSAEIFVLFAKFQLYPVTLCRHHRPRFSFAPERAPFCH